MKNIAILLVIFAISIALLISQIKKRDFLIDDKSDKSGEISVILTGFGSKDEEGNWIGEASVIIDNAEDVQDVGSNIPMCQSGFEGTFFGSKVLIATSGKAKVKTTACLSDIFHYYGKNVKEVIVVGIAGITPMKGGLLDSQGNARNSEKVMLGDVCLNSISYDFDLQHYSSDQVSTNLPDPVYWSEGNNFTSDYSKGNVALANELYSASLKVDWIETPQKVKDVNIFYHNITRKPKVWGLSECMEVTGDQYWHDIRADARAREIAVGYMNREYGTKLNPSDILIATSMEALPAGVYVDWWNKYQNSKVAFAYVRGAANFDQVSLKKDLTPIESGKESLERSEQAGGAQYAIETSSLPVLKMFELRSKSK